MLARPPAPFNLILRGRIVLPGQPPAKGALAILDGRVAAVSEYTAALPAEREIDVGDALVLPGAVDVHVHTSSTPEEGVESCTRAAAAGGVTTVLDMPYDVGGMVADLDAFDAKVALVGREAHVDVGLWATVTPEGALDCVPALVEAGACAFKLSTFATEARRFPRIPDGQLHAAFAQIASAGGLAGVHSENDELVRHGIQTLQAAGRRDPAAHGESRPAVVETEAIGRCLELARATGVRLHLCHVTVGRGAELARRARADGVDVSVETCPHYLLLDEREIVRRGGEAKINPPLRPAAEVEALWSGLAGGNVHIVASDHVGWPPGKKSGDDVFGWSSGAPGVELIVPLMHDATAARGLPPQALVRLLCEAPARRFGMWPRKGNLLPGADADVVVLDPDEEWVIDPQQLETGAGWSPYAGRRLRGRVRAVFARGEEVFDGRNVLSRPGRGRFVARPAGRDELLHV